MEEDGRGAWSKTTPMTHCACPNRLAAHTTRMGRGVQRSFSPIATPQLLWTIARHGADVKNKSGAATNQGQGCVPCPDSICLHLELQLQPELELSRSTGGVHPGTGPYPQRISCREVADRSSIHRSRRTVQESAEVIGSAVEVPEIEQVEDRERRLDRHSLFDPDGPGKFRIEAASPAHIHLVRWSQRQRVGDRSQ